MIIYHLHELSGKKEGIWSLDINGRKCGYRLLIKPLNKDLPDKANINSFYGSINNIRIEEVSKHYE